MNIKVKLQRNPLTKNIYPILKKMSDKQKLKDKFSYHGIFDNRSRNKDCVCIVLAGYKEFLYENVFERLQKFSSDQVDMCIVTSGKYSEKLRDLCKSNNWSYLSTKENNVALVQNVAIKLHPKAKLIFKLDEDIFITNNYFEKMIIAYEHAKKQNYKLGFIAPIIPINGFSHILVLEKLGLVDDYEKRFERPIMMAGDIRQVQSNPEVAKYFWGKDKIIPQIDDLNRLFEKEDIDETLCPIRFSIGAILFEREFWETMGYYDVDKTGTAMGVDETQMCGYCMRASRPIVVSKNVVVGHFSFGPQTFEMKEYYLKHRNDFEIKHNH